MQYATIQQDSRITDYANEAKDNVKYLYTLDKFFGPLVKCNPVRIFASFLSSLFTLNTSCTIYTVYALKNVKTDGSFQ